ncbi:MFS transporter, partial [Escherichia coli]|nr:MFS transporter [Escherichia coli]
ALALEGAAAWHGHAGIAAQDFPLAFLGVAVISAGSFLIFRRLAPDAGAEVSGQRRVAEAVPRPADGSPQSLAPVTPRHAPEPGR